MDGGHRVGSGSGVVYESGVVRWYSALARGTCDRSPSEPSATRPRRDQRRSSSRFSSRCRCRSRTRPNNAHGVTGAPRPPADLGRSPPHPFRSASYPKRALPPIASSAAESLVRRSVSHPARSLGVTPLACKSVSSCPSASSTFVRTGVKRMSWVCGSGK